MGALKRVAKGGNFPEPSPGSFRVLKSVATALCKMGLVDIACGSEHRRSEFGKETGPVFVTAIITVAGKEVVASEHFPKKRSRR